MSSDPDQSSSPITLNTFSPAQTPELIAFLNRVLAGHRHWAPISETDFAARVLDRPGFDPGGLILARAGGRVFGGIHAIKPALLAESRHHIAWLAVEPDFRDRGVGDRLLRAAENYLYYCPVYFAAQSAPFYGIIESLWTPWYGSTERMGVSALHDRELINWLGRRGYQPTKPGDVSLRAGLHDRPRPADPGLTPRGLSLAPIDERSPWTGDEPFYQLRGWGANGGRPYRGLVVADGERAVGSVVWYPLPDNETAALAWIGLERYYRGLRYGSYLLDMALHGMARQGYLAVEVHVHSKESPEALALFRRRGFQVTDYWVNLVKT
jgi:ribosomal protein S18 acetylase RimI-like enzyme